MLAPWKKSYDKTRQLIEKADISYWDITLPTKVHIVKAMIFPVVMYGCENWTIKKAEPWTGAFELWCWRRLLRVPWIAMRWNQSILKEINPEYSLEGLMLKLKLQYFGHLMGKLTQWTYVWANSRRLWRRGKPGLLQSMGLQIIEQDWVTEEQQEVHEFISGLSELIFFFLF